MDYPLSILIIYTGGTIGMMEDPVTGYLSPVNFVDFIKGVPDLKRFGLKISATSFEIPIDSATITITDWVNLVEIIEENYYLYDGFVILHGTDTMAYTASALSFMLEDNYKPIILTGAQLPIGAIRTDGKENLVTSVEIAAARRNGRPIVPEVCIYFENKLLRGNRTTKYSAEHFNAFRAVNYPVLAEVGIHIKYNFPAIHYPPEPYELKVHKNLDTNIGLIKLYPGINEALVDAVLNTKGLKAIVLETFGSGNAMVDLWFLNRIKAAIESGIIILNVSQCFGGSVEMGRYNTSRELSNFGVLSGFDTTTESALTKLMFLLGLNISREEVVKRLKSSVAGEVTVNP
jgi:L-asparaginase